MRRRLPPRAAGTFVSRHLLVVVRVVTFGSPGSPGPRVGLGQHPATGLLRVEPPAHLRAARCGSSRRPASEALPEEDSAVAGSVVQPRGAGNGSRLGVGLGVRAAGQDRVVDRAGNPLVGDRHSFDVEGPATLAAPSGRGCRVHPSLRVPVAFCAQSHNGTTFLLMSAPRGPSCPASWPASDIGTSRIGGIGSVGPSVPGVAPGSIADIGSCRPAAGYGPGSRSASQRVSKGCGPRRPSSLAGAVTLAPREQRRLGARSTGYLYVWPAPMTQEALGLARRPR